MSRPAQKKIKADRYPTYEEVEEMLFSRDDLALLLGTSDVADIENGFVLLKHHGAINNEPVTSLIELGRHNATHRAFFKPYKIVLNKATTLGPAGTMVEHTAGISIVTDVGINTRSIVNVANRGLVREDYTAWTKKLHDASFYPTKPSRVLLALARVRAVHANVLLDKFVGETKSEPTEAVGDQEADKNCEGDDSDDE